MPDGHYATRLRGYILCAVLAIVGLNFSPGVTFAYNKPTSREILDNRATSTIGVSTRVKFIIYANNVPNGTIAEFGLANTPTPLTPSYLKRIGLVYELHAGALPAWSQDRGRRALVVLPGTKGTWKRDIWMYDQAQSKWRRLPTKIYAGRKIAVADVPATQGLFALFEDQRTQYGVASWYCRKACSSRYPVYHGTSNDFPVGSMVRVQNAETGRVVSVKIVSGWGQPAGRVIDLSYPAFAKIKGSNEGLVRVEVSSTKTPPKRKTVVVKSVAPDPSPKFTVQKKDQAVRPGSSAVSYVVLDEGTGTILVEKNGTRVRSIASITKLMTAAVALESGLDLRSTLVYRKADITPYAYLRLSVGETLPALDLLYATLVGSANNGAALLARASGLSSAEFIKRMNTKARSYGMNSTKFVDVHGLGQGNTASARDVARLAAHVFLEFPILRDVMATKSFKFQTINTERPHTIRTTDRLLEQSRLSKDLTFAGSKTGFTDEALYTYVLRVSLPNKAKVIVSILGAPDSVARFHDAAALAAWVWQHYLWSRA